MIPMSKWIGEQNPIIRRRIGKLGEECAELMKVLHRVDLQGIDGIDPATGKANRRCLAEEIADVLAQLDCCIAENGLSLDSEFILHRRLDKRAQMRRWESLYTSPEN